MIPIFLAPGIVSHNFQSGKMHLSVILSHLCGVRHLGRAKIKIPMFDLVWQVQYWCQFLYFVTPEIVSRKFQSGKMHDLRATLSQFCATWWPLEDKN